MRVLYINFVDFNFTSTGSSVRPKKIYQALLSCGHEVDMITGYYTRKNIQGRKDAIRKQILKLGQYHYDFCYIEPPSGIINRFYNKCDYSLIKEISKKCIPIGVFYRDIYWKFHKYFKIKGIKAFLIKTMMIRDLNFLKKYCDIFFIPSDEMGRYLSVNCKIALPPACEILNVKTINIQNAIIYVGGTSFAYGTDILLEAMKIVNTRRSVILNLVCRKDEIGIINSFIEKEKGLPQWLKVIHVSGEELENVYAKSDFAIYSSRKSPYYDFCMPIKIFEYISYLKPILTTNCKEIEKLVISNELGIVKSDDPFDLAEGVIELYENGLNKYIPNLLKYRERNKWSDRIDKISGNLLNVKNGKA